MSSVFDGYRRGWTMCDRCAESDNQAANSSRRRKLWEIGPQYHCAILGTCLTMVELRKVMRQSGVALQNRPSDYDLHAVLVAQAEHNGRPARNLQRMLDGKYRRWVSALSKCRDRSRLAYHWQAAVASGDIAGTFWALATHARADEELIRSAYEDVHMLSHIQGSSNRADLQRLNQLEREVSDLQEELERTGRYHRQQLEKRDGLIRRQSQQLAVAIQAKAEGAAADDSERIRELEREVQSMARRLEWTESRLAEREMALDRLTQERLGLKELLMESKQERDALEHVIQRLLQAENEVERETGTEIDLNGTRVLYVGGQPGLTPHLRSLVAAHNGRFAHHDGGVEESKAGLQGALAGADVVFCPIDCVSHDACQRAKTHCWRQHKQFIPLRSSGLSAFAARLRDYSVSGAAAGAEETIEIG